MTLDTFHDYERNCIVLSIETERIRFVAREWLCSAQSCNYCPSFGLLVMYRDRLMHYPYCTNYRDIQIYTQFTRTGLGLNPGKRRSQQRNTESLVIIQTC
jgi:hypothetical protein